MLYKHTLRNAMLPIVTNLGMSVSGLIGGSVVIEQIFNWNGMGTLFLNANNTNDYPLMMGIMLFLSFFALVANPGDGSVLLPARSAGDGRGCAPMNAKRFFSRLGTSLLDSLKGAGRFIAKLWKHPKGRVGLIIAGFLVIMAVFAPLIAPYDPYDVTQRAEKGLAPCLAHPLGTTITTGQDILSMLIYGTRVSLVVGVVTGLCTAFLGALMGVLTGYLGGIVDMLVMRVVDIMLVIPTLPLTIVLTNLFGKSYFMIIFIFTIFGWTGLARVVRSQVLVLKNSNYVKAAELAGARRGHIMFRHILPGVLPPAHHEHPALTSAASWWRRRGFPSLASAIRRLSAGAKCSPMPRAAAPSCLATGGGFWPPASEFSSRCSRSCGSASRWRKSSIPA